MKIWVILMGIVLWHPKVEGLKVSRDLTLNYRTQGTKRIKVGIKILPLTLNNNLITKKNWITLIKSTKIQVTINKLSEWSRPKLEAHKIQEGLKILPQEAIITLFLKILAIILYRSRCTVFLKAPDNLSKWPKTLCKWNA